MQNISSNNQTPSYKGHLSIVVILSNSPRWPLYRGRSKRGGCAHPLKLEKIWFFLAQNRDFSNEIPQKFSRLPPQWEKIRLFGVKSWFTSTQHLPFIQTFLEPKFNMTTNPWMYAEIINILPFISTELQ
jgi:hypothetical protein